MTDEEAREPVQVVHPDLQPHRKPVGVGKVRRTTVRVAKLVNPYSEGEVGEGELPRRRGAEMDIRQVPIEPSHNNRDLNDPAGPLRFYLNKGFKWPHNDPEAMALMLKEAGRSDLAEQVPFVFCAVKDCWEPADLPATERCKEHEVAWDKGLISYAIPGQRNRLN